MRKLYLVILIASSLSSYSQTKTNTKKEKINISLIGTAYLFENKTYGGATFSMLTTHKSPAQIGIVGGLAKISDDGFSYPVGLNFRLSSSKSNISPVIDVQGGVLIYNQKLAPSTYIKGLSFFNAGAGIVFGNTKNASFMILGKYQVFTTTLYLNNRSSGNSKAEVFQISLGINFH